MFVPDTVKGLLKKGLVTELMFFRWSIAEAKKLKQSGEIKPNEVISKAKEIRQKIIKEDLKDTVWNWAFLLSMIVFLIWACLSRTLFPSLLDTNSLINVLIIILVVVPTPITGYITTSRAYRFNKRNEPSSTMLSIHCEYLRKLLPGCTKMHTDGEMMKKADESLLSLAKKILYLEKKNQGESSQVCELRHNIGWSHGTFSNFALTKKSIKSYYKMAAELI